MILKRFYDEKLAQASYLIGCDATGESIVIDPNRDAEQYLAGAARERLRIGHVTETHIHADFVSGSRELAARTGARLYLSGEGGDDWHYGFAEQDGAVLLQDGDALHVGNVRIDVLHTPGHTPEHVCFVVTDTASADQPMGVVTGDFVFVGDVGRPDLLEKAARLAGSTEAAARQLFRSLQQFRAYPDYLQLWPGHGAGSACGKSLGAVPQSTLGYEKLFNWAFGHRVEDEFVRAVVEGQPDPPKYFAQMKRVNRDGPRVLGGFTLPRQLEAARLTDLLREGALVVDARPAAAYAAGHARGTLNIPLNRAFTTWAGWLLPYDRDFYLLLPDSSERLLHEAVRDLAMIGFDRVAGYFTESALAESSTGLGTLERVPGMSVAELAPRLANGEYTVVDVRNASEWAAGHLPGVRHIPLGHLPERAAEIPRDQPVVVHCQSGGRSAIAASVLRAAGFPTVINLYGGFSAWATAGLPIERDASAHH